MAAKGPGQQERTDTIFSEAWIPIAFLFLIVGLIFGRNPAAIAVGLTLLLIVVVGGWWNRRSLQHVDYSRHYDRTHVFPGEPVTITFSLANRKFLPLTWLQVRDQLPVAPVDASEFAVKTSEMTRRYMIEHSTSIGSFSEIRQEVKIAFSKRGYYFLGPTELNSGDLFTMFTSRRRFDYRERLVVYPPVWTMEQLDLPARQMFGELRARRSLFTDPIQVRGIRHYRPGDRFRDIHWKATAVRRELQTKINEPSTGMSVVLFLNVTTFRQHWMGFDPEKLEAAVSVTASIADYAARRKWQLGLMANGTVPGSDQPIRVRPGSSRDQLMHVLESLAAVTAFATGSITDLMLRESPGIPFAATFVLVTPLITGQMQAGLARLVKAGRRVVIVGVGSESLNEFELSLPSYAVPDDSPLFAASAVIHGSQQQQEPITLTPTQGNGVR